MCRYVNSQNAFLVFVNNELWYFRKIKSLKEKKIKNVILYWNTKIPNCFNKY